MFRQFNECEPIEVGWKAIAHVADSKTAIARATVLCSPCRRVELAEGIIAQVPIDRSRAFEILIIADRTTRSVGSFEVLELPILAHEIRAGKTWLLKAWAQLPPQPPPVGCIQ